MKKQLLLTMGLLSVISFSRGYAAPTALLDRLMEDGIIRDEPVSLFPAREQTPVAAPSQQTPPTSAERVQPDDDNNARKKVTDQLARIATLEAKLQQSEAAKARAEQQIMALQAKQSATAPVFSLEANKGELARVNYAWGVWFAAKAQLESRALKDVGKAFVAQAFLQGVKDRFENHLQMRDSDIDRTLATLNKQINDARQREMTRNKKQGEQLLASAARQKGAVRESNGAVYLVENKGQGAMVKDSDTIRFKVDEKISTGQILSRGEVSHGRVSELPVVMRTGVKKLAVGGRVTMHVPGELAYGEEGIPGVVPPGVVSVITLDVLAIEP
ncbi:FKBP-type peptidyl-prolyl cis-trans isomerase [Kosakonia oryzendophytica]|uniref:peptidylprolyl isomerase n=1 Tax=Kosakonia oryzendophytica TaxID=1005665 RepID=A0A1C4DFM0_9ENTR|nr:FKBP-type peptidyl-prolyl cis-trans isomerase N-terminal domain-containing protein [Kosakonia oryzendophytica]SCC30185.1 FKBP-type peptidyl-prolyl cis-trans isomerase [Kosakonia oryzendophytica]